MQLLRNLGLPHMTLQEICNTHATALLSGGSILPLWPMCWALVGPRCQPQRFCVAFGSISWRRAPWTVVIF